MKINEINPYVRYCGIHKFFNNQMFVGANYLVAYDSRLLYCLSGSGMVEIENRMYEMHKDVMLLFRYGLRYKYHHNEKRDMECLSANFDYDYRYAEDYANRIPPDTPSNYDPKRVLSTPCFDDIIYIADASKIKSELLKAYSCYIDSNMQQNAEIGARMKLIITLAIGLYENERSDIHTVSSDLINEICRFIDENAESINCGKDVSDKFSYHTYYINRLMKKAFGITLHSYILKAKVNRSVDYLTTTDMPISEIAFKCGFFDTSHYSKIFKRITGYSPSKYRYI